MFLKLSTVSQKEFEASLSTNKRPVYKQTTKGGGLESGLLKTLKLGGSEGASQVAQVKLLLLSLTT